MVIACDSQNMPQSCCVPGCTKKVYEEDGFKISYHKFPEEKELFRKWIVAIRRDIGKEFRVTEHTRVCSRHFKSRDYVTSLAGRKRTLITTAVPSVFFWKEGSPVKRKSPKKRSPVKRKNVARASETTTANAVNANTSSTCDRVTAVAESESADLLASANVNEQLAEEQISVEELQGIIRDKSMEIERQKKEIIEITTSLANLKLEQEELTCRNAALQARVFSVQRFLQSDKDMNFYTGFPDRSVFEAVFEYLEPGKEGENINYWHSVEDSTVHTNQNCEEHIPKQGRPRLLDPKEEFFLTICRLRQGFKEEHLSHLYNIP